jgi:hypothetical protein
MPAALCRVVCAEENFSALDTTGKSAARRHLSKIAWPAPAAGRGLFLDPTLMQGCFNSSKQLPHVVSNSFTNSKG